MLDVEVKPNSIVALIMAGWVEDYSAPEEEVDHDFFQEFQQCFTFGGISEPEALERIKDHCVAMLELAEKHQPNSTNKEVIKRCNDYAYVLKEVDALLS